MSGDRPVKLAARHLWKLFGPDAGRFMRDRPAASPEELHAAGLVPAVVDAGFEIRELDVFYDKGAPKFVAAYSLGVAVSP